MGNSGSFLCRVILSFLLFATGAQASAANAGALRILTEDNPPLNFAKDGEITGLATEVVRELVKRTGTAGTIRMVAWPDGYQTLSEHPNVALFSTVMTAERKGRFQWVGPLAVVDTNLYALKGSGIQIANLDQARKAGRIATVRKYYSEQVLKDEGFSNTESFPDRETSVRKLLDGKVQLVASSNTEMP
jgi:polar amino acid transport system substrate-binding protein